MTSTPPPLVRCDRVTRVFGSGSAAVVAVQDLSCAVQPRDLIVITGPSGSGKSTLLHMLAGLDHPTSGKVSWPGLGADEKLWPGSVGIVFQGPSLIAPLDVVENVALPLLLGGAEQAEGARRAAAILGRQGLSELAAKLPEELSAGQAQRVAVARAIAIRPRLILADEPTGQLDHANAGRVLETLLEAATSTGAALVLTTHDPSVARRFSSLWTMEDGRLGVAAAAPC
jgi:ABC-type lipoprotein export system ATPase subunit